MSIGQSWRQRQACALFANLAVFDQYVLRDAVEARSESRAVVNKIGVHWFDADDEVGVALHRTRDQPAIVGSNGSKYWYKNGKIHRDGDKPATVYAGLSKWCQHGQLHRDNDEPAIVYADGSRMWYRDGQLHRDNGMPAVVRLNSRVEWWRHGVFMREAYTDIYSTNIN